MLTDMTEQRLMLLETRFAYQDKLVTDLNDALISQQKQLDTALARIRILEAQLKSLVSAAEQPPNEAPPHY